jgi:CRISPR-associated protein Cas1
MVPYILEINENGRYIGKQQGFIVIQEGKQKYGQVPIDDIGIMMISAYGATITKDVLVCLAERGAVTVLCGTNCSPTALVVPATVNYEMPLRVKLQVSTSEPLKKRLWQAIVRSKLLHQATILREVGDIEKANYLKQYAKEVQSGDPNNREASGARVYWKALFGENFTRNKNGNWPNGALNYGYAILRSAVIRALYSVGLLPLFGIHHDNTTNPFPLADDMMEPFRPLVDYIVKTQIDSAISELTPSVKQSISKVLWADCYLNNEITPLNQGLQQFCYSLVKSLKQKKVLLEIPDFGIKNAVS